MTDLGVEAGREAAARMQPDFWTWTWEAIAAHVLELGRAGVIDEAALAALARGLDAAREPGERAPGIAGVIDAIDRRIDAVVPGEIEGVASFGRQHHELKVTVLRLAAREGALTLIAAVNDLRAVLHRFASEHMLTYLPGLVDGQAAEPTTLANLLGATLDPLEHAAAALRTAYERLDRSPLGAGLLAGDVLELDRAALAARLGFAAVLNPTFNAASNVEDLAALTQAIEGAVAPVDRLLRDVAQWLRADPESFRLGESWLEAPEPGLIAFTPASGLERLIQRCRRVTARATALVTNLRALGYGPVGSAVDALLDDVTELAAGAKAALNESAALFDTGLIPNRAYLANRVGRGLITTGDLALYLVTEEGLPLAAARQIAGMVVARALEGGPGLVGVTPDAIDTAALMVMGQDVKTEMEPLGRYFAPRRYLERRRVAGAPAPDMTRAWLVDSESHVQSDRAWLNGEHGRIDRAMTALSQAVADAADEAD